MFEVIRLEIMNFRCMLMTKGVSIFSFVFQRISEDLCTLGICMKTKSNVNDYLSV